MQSQRAGAEASAGAWMYRARLPRTKLTSPAPGARVQGKIELADRPALRLDGWRGMVGHNWGAEHAERWIWLHGVGFEQAPEAWLDVALGRIGVAGRLTPWVANGALSIGGRRLRVGGVGKARAARERERGALRAAPAGSARPADRCEGEGAEGQRGAGGTAIGATPTRTGGEHEVVNCSIAAIELD